MRRGGLPPLLGALLLAHAASAVQFIGCMFEDLCEDSERCFNDGAFGRCVSQLARDEELTSLELSQDDIADLVGLLEHLVAEGHRWSHIYTQCVLQSKLLALQTGEKFDGSACELVNGQQQLLPPDSRGVPALPVEEADEEEGPPSQKAGSDEALVRFGPPEDEYVEELYVPATYRTNDKPLVRGLYDRPLPTKWNWTPTDNEMEDYADVPLSSDSGALLPAMLKRSAAADDTIVLPPAETRLIEELARDIGRQLSDSSPDYSPDYPHDYPPEYPPDYPSDYSPDYPREAVYPASAPDSSDYPDGPAELVIDYEPDYPADYPPAYPPDYPDYAADYPEYGDVEPIPLSVRSDPEFRRAERLDIKKPGPWFGINNYAFDYDYDGKGPAEENIMETIERLPMEPMESEASPQLTTSLRPAGDEALSVDSESRRVDEVAEDVTRAEDVTKAALPGSTALPAGQTYQAAHQQDKKAMNEKFSSYPDPRDAIDDSYAFLKTQNSFRTWKDGKQLVEQLEKDLSVPPNTFDRIRVIGNQVTFKVNPNSQGLNSSLVAKRIDGLRRQVEQELGVTILYSGVGDGTSDSGAPSVSVEPDESSALFVRSLSIVLGVLVAAIVLVVLVVCLARRYTKSRDKVKGIANPDTEASRDYQELCRSRMAARVTEKSDSPEKPQRVHSLSKESDGTASPTSRSSTSSWSEEPVVSNMDISTGHMVLSYMEDHLKKKDKLEEEWRALCAYEAEPSARTVALLPENAKKNRFQHALPYDHSRVALNAVTNATGSDYINASPITDHDPRNPAYIATQGPLPQTANDFWQMVWEQGSVVIVMLTRLTENGSGMCHRYWPEEGSELYHIYEVHLVSEHIWCDEYLVRSFYLKNLKTSETRTVTQFHFLAWPENGVPTSTKALLEFRRKVNKSYRGRSCPVVVHCSDGCGRSGTYCLIDMVLNRMAKGAKEIDIAASLEHLRDQRADMVRTRAQFEFVLMAVAEEVHAILKALPQ